MTDTIRISNAKGLYLEGIRDGNMVEALDKYTGERYTQHSTGVRDGKDGFIEFSPLRFWSITPFATFRLCAPSRMGVLSFAMSTKTWVTARPNG